MILRAYPLEANLFSFTMPIKRIVKTGSIIIIDEQTNGYWCRNDYLGQDKVS
jgi:hypothetical protein